jgi:3-oxoacyl-[acyl-carrier protein] reductase
MVGGCTQGLGKAIAYQLAESGAELVLVARNEEKLQKILSELPTDHNQKHSYLLVDFSDFQQFKDIVSSYFQQNSVDILVNNTQGPAFGNVLEMQAENYESAFNLLFQTNVFLSQQALKGMQKNGFGRIINLSSITTKEPLSHLVLSNTMRTALISWAKSLAKEVAADGITVNSLLTGYFETERLQNIIKLQSEKKGISYQEFAKNMQVDIPAKRFGKPEEFAHLVTFLASDFAGYITGANIPIDGGFLKCL